MLEALNDPSFIGMHLQRLLPIRAFDPLEAQREPATNGCEQFRRVRFMADQLSCLALGNSHTAVAVCVCLLLLSSLAVMLLVYFPAVAPILLLLTLFSMLRCSTFLSVPVVVYSLLESLLLVFPAFSDLRFLSFFVERVFSA